MLKVFIGYDSNESIAYHVLAHSIMRRASRPVSITPLYLPQLRQMGAYTRQRGPTESTEFSISRFLTPWLSGFHGVSIFMDCDMLVLDDICKLEEYALADPYNDVYVVKHDYTPSTATKFLGQPQTAYPCKNWSSVMVFNGHRMPVRRLTPGVVNNLDPAYLHRFQWASDVGALPARWNWLVGEQEEPDDPAIVHYTLGGPWFPEYRDCPYAREWFAEAANAMSAQRSPLLLPVESGMMQAVNSDVDACNGNLP